ncbi:uncharacterized protein LOC104897884 isoform X1 [Beta vulgaris subsp. vulgaris]|uniref:uncharacterized protein LOC104897884 isoform X1 n=2 Tax=Beta vulgaris subsp. vulgaris TaxID=3555 RepID=UPI002548E897|nr:uncharacterized protein LOC104897884 isoform X1 [Beta vulgaris subsp. vulgaris]XP_057251485.1 uncharacterized protein LOC104897884 isoform X1 [Beta vulgaris subsp. vulgaris]XP_057251486.1 uncharacterized protein LOC104897884 isoform X1 [Beta vulgaris subsp. vulgaris]
MTMATGFLIVPCTTTSQISDAWKQRSRRIENCSQLISSKYHLNFSSFSSLHCSSACCDPPYLCLSSHLIGHGRIPSSHQYVISCVSSSSHPTSPMSTRLYVSGLSFRTTHESLRNAFQKFGQLMEVNLVMDKIANRPRGFAFIRYETEEESKNAIEGMHGKIEDILYQKNLYQPLTDKPADMEEAKWKVLDRQALAVVRLTLARTVAFNVKDIKTTAELIKALSDMYEKPSAMNKFLDGRVIFVEEAKPRSDIRKNQQNLRESRR